LLSFFGLAEMIINFLFMQKLLSHNTQIERTALGRP